MVTLNNTTTTNPYLDQNRDFAKQNEAIQNITKENETVKSIEKSAVEVSLSMNAQIVLFSMDAEQLNKDNITAQTEIFDLLSGKEIDDNFDLEDIGYEGKPITELSQDEANELISEGGFFSIEETSSRVAEFALGFSDDPEIIKQALEGIKKGFEEAEKMWGGELPEISYKTQERTLELINERLTEIENTNNESTTSDDGYYPEAESID